MLFLKSLLSYLLLPPANLALAVLAGVLLLPWRPCLGRWVVGTATALWLLLGMPVIGDNLLLSLEQNLPLTPPPNAPPGAIVILGGTMDETAGRPPGFALGALTLERVRAGAALYRKTHLPILVTGGKLGSAAPALSVLMARSLEQDFQVPVRWIEPKSQDTWENAVLSAAMLRKAGIHSVYVVTHAWHERRALIAFRHAGLIATAAPTQRDRFSFGLPASVLPSPNVWLRSYFAVHEWVGCVWYSLP